MSWLLMDSTGWHLILAFFSPFILNKTIFSEIAFCYGKMDQTASKGLLVPIKPEVALIRLQKYCKQHTQIPHIHALALLDLIYFWVFTCQFLLVCIIYLEWKEGKTQILKKLSKCISVLSPHPFCSCPGEFTHLMVQFVSVISPVTRVFFCHFNHK